MDSKIGFEAVKQYQQYIESSLLDEKNISQFQFI